MYWFEQSINSFIYICSEGILCVFQYVYLNREITYILKSNAFLPNEYLHINCMSHEDCICKAVSLNFVGVCWPDYRV